jgi:alanine racemase
MIVANVSGQHVCPETSVERVAELADTIPYEITCAVGNRIERVAVR